MSNISMVTREAGNTLSKVSDVVQKIITVLLGFHTHTFLQQFLTFETRLWFLTDLVNYYTQDEIRCKNVYL